MVPQILRERTSAGQIRRDRLRWGGRLLILVADAGGTRKQCDTQGNILAQVSREKDGLAMLDALRPFRDFAQLILLDMEQVF